MELCNSPDANKNVILTNQNITASLSQDEYNKIFMSADADFIIKYFDDAVSKALSDTFLLKKSEKGHWWYGDWENHCRMVITLFAAKGTHYYINWGYNFDFIPHLNRQGKFIWSRTEKSFAEHISDNFFSHIQYDSKTMLETETLHILDQYTLPIYANNLNAALDYIDVVVKRNIPFMLEWFSRVQTTDDVIAELDRQLGKYNDYRDYSRYWTKAFLLARQKRLEEAVETLENYYVNRTIEQKVLDKLHSTSLLD